MPLFDRAHNVLAELQAAEIGSRPICWVTHSMGGLLVKQILRNAHSLAPEFRAFSAATRCVSFIGTPHTGSDLAGIARYLGFILRLSAASKELQALSSPLLELNTWYRENHRRLGVSTQVFFENQATKGVRVVDRGTADPGLEGVMPIGLDADHVSICKPLGRDDLIYKRTRAFILGAADPRSANKGTSSADQGRKQSMTLTAEDVSESPSALGDSESRDNDDQEIIRQPLVPETPHSLPFDSMDFTERTAETGRTAHHRVVVDFSTDGRVSVATWIAGESSATGDQASFEWPLDDSALEDLRWYLEDYLRAPFGVYAERGPQIQTRLKQWGEELFAAVFGSDPGREVYMQIRARNVPFELVFRSATRELFELPWELIRDPARPIPLALELAGISRSQPLAPSVGTVPVPGGRLRILMVISRPEGLQDVNYRMVALPLLRRLKAVRGPIDLVVLRPPTLNALNEVLTAAVRAGRPFQVVHFDGHGVSSQRANDRSGNSSEGSLVFQLPDGGADPVPFSLVAEVLGTARVPVVVLNSCGSGGEGRDLEASVATRLLAGGAASVVAMNYSVYAVAAAEFMAAFYERLFAGDTVVEAVTAGRQRLSMQNRRPSPKGEMALEDWMVPVHYLSRSVSFPQASIGRPEELPSLNEALDRLATPTTAREAEWIDDLDAAGTFVGRDTLFFELEMAIPLQKGVILYGPAGVGKTEMARAFGRWWRDTGGVSCPEWVLWYSFEPNTPFSGLDGVVSAVGRQLYGAEFASLDAGKRQAVIRGLLDQRRMMLILDNFQAINSMPSTADAGKLRDEAAQQEIREFLTFIIRKSSSSAIIISRTTENWLGDVRRIRIGSLNTNEAAEYASNLLAPYPAAAMQRRQRAFDRLMEWLDGHPLSMCVILPSLNTTEPAKLLDGLRGDAPLRANDDTDDSKIRSMLASIESSVTRLSQRHQRILPAVGLFRGVADTTVLAQFSQVTTVPARFSAVSKQEWAAALQDAAEAGLLYAQDSGMFRFVPALSAYLAAQWRLEDADDYSMNRDAAMHALTTAYATHSAWLGQKIDSRDARSAYSVIELQQRTLETVLDYALDHQMWEQAQAIARTLGSVWSSEEAEAWRDKMQFVTEGSDGSPPSLGTAVGALWLFSVRAQAERYQAQNRLDEAERIYQRILTMLQAQPASELQQDLLSFVSRQLSAIAERRAAG